MIWNLFVSYSSKSFNPFIPWLGNGIYSFSVSLVGQNWTWVAIRLFPVPISTPSPQKKIVKYNFVLFIFFV